MANTLPGGTTMAITGGGWVNSGIAYMTRGNEAAGQPGANHSRQAPWIANMGDGMTRSWFEFRLPRPANVTYTLHLTVRDRAGNTATANRNNVRPWQDANNVPRACWNGNISACQ